MREEEDEEEEEKIGIEEIEREKEIHGEKYKNLDSGDKSRRL